MNRLPILAAAALAAVAVTTLPSSASAASFSCKGHVTYTEKAICDNPNLSQLDSIMARSYFRLLNHSYGWQRNKLQRDQIRWLVNRDSCGANVRCLTTAYQTRLAQIDYRQY